MPREIHAYSIATTSIISGTSSRPRAGTHRLGSCLPWKIGPLVTTASVAPNTMEASVRSFGIARTSRCFQLARRHLRPRGLRFSPRRLHLRPPLRPLTRYVWMGPCLQIGVARAPNIRLRTALKIQWLSALLQIFSSSVASAAAAPSRRPCRRPRPALELRYRSLRRHHRLCQHQRLVRRRLRPLVVPLARRK